MRRFGDDSQLQSKKTVGGGMDSDEDEKGDQIPSLLKGGNTGLSQSKKEQKGKGITPFLKKKENVEDKARIMEINVSNQFL